MVGVELGQQSLSIPARICRFVQGRDQGFGGGQVLRLRLDALIAAVDDDQAADQGGNEVSNHGGHRAIDALLVFSVWIELCQRPADAFVDHCVGVEVLAVLMKDDAQDTGAENLGIGDIN